jgi:hypothetical protein
MECGHPMRNQPDMRGRRLIGERFPFREPGEVFDGTIDELVEEAQVIEHSFGGLVVRSQNYPWTGTVWGIAAGVVQQAQGAGRRRTMGSKQADTSLF